MKRLARSVCTACGERMGTGSTGRTIDAQSSGALSEFHDHKPGSPLHAASSERHVSPSQNS